MNADDLSALLNALVKEGRPRDAEDLLFSQYEKQPSGEVYEAGLESWGLQYDAALLRQEAGNVRAGAGTGNSGIQTIVEGGIKLSSLISKDL